MDTELISSFAERLSIALEERHMSAAELSRKSNIPEAAISNYKKGNYKATQTKLAKIAEALNVSIPWLMGYDVPISPYTKKIKVSSFQERLQERMNELDLRQTDVAERTGLQHAQIYHYINGTYRPKAENIEILANALGVTSEWLQGYDIISAEDYVNRGIKIPVLGRVTAGIPIDAVEEIIDYEEIDSHMASQGEFFALQVKGDSMNPRFVDGDVVIVRKQSDADTGDVVIVLINGEDATIKRLQKFDGGINLVPTNPAFDILTFTNKQIKSLPVVILGKVVELRGKF